MDTFDTIHRLAAEKLRIPAEALLRATTLDEAGIDSLGAVDLIFAIETRFAVAIPEEAVARVGSLHDLAVVVDRLITRRTHSHDG